MKPYLGIEERWFDEDLREIKIEACDGRSLFSCDAYVALSWPQETADDLINFRTHIPGGLYDLRAGDFGIEHGNGAMHARLHFRPPGTLYISAHLQSEFREYKGTKVASEARLYLYSEPVLLDRFIDELRAFGQGTRSDATLMAIDPEQC